VGDALPNYVLGSVMLGPGEHPFGTKYAIERPMMRFEPGVYLDALMRDVLNFGGRIQTRTFDTPRDLMALTEPIVVNCTGLGAKALFGDTELVPVKGQLTVLVPQPEVTYMVGSMMPRSDGIVIGSTSEAVVWTLDVNEGAQQRIGERHTAIFNAMHAPLVGSPVARLELAYHPRVETFLRWDS
jgi:D-amino-acid oxidase